MPKQSEAQVFSIDAASSIIGCDRRTLGRALAGVRADAHEGAQKRWTLRHAVSALIAYEGAPRQPRGRKGKASNGFDIAAERAGLIRAKREEAERKNALDAGRLVAVGKVANIVEQEFSVVREHFLALPGKNADAVAAGVAALLGLTPQVLTEIRTVIEATIRGHIHEALDELSRPEAIAERATAGE